MEMVNSFKRFLKAIVPHMVIKSNREAEYYETLDSRLAGDEYIGAVLETDNLLVMRPARLTREILNTVGIFDDDEIHAIWEDVELIPKDKRQRVIELCRATIISGYVEQNNYYRMLNGQPDLNEDPIYVEPKILAQYGYQKDKQEDYDNGNTDALTPLHLLPQVTLNAMEAYGYLDQLYNYYKGLNNDYNPEYIKYLGLRKIDIVTARMAGHFELLYLPRPENANRFHRDFTMYYEEARHYMMTQIYNYHYSATHNYYESYMGFFTLVMAIQRMVDSMFEVMVDRDFYDLETCRMFLEAYGVPFIKQFTFRQQKILVKNLNILIMNKCTSQVMYDILSLLEFDTYALTKYLLVKQHKTYQLSDSDEPKPLFIYKSILDEDGNISYELDKHEMYDYYFVGVPLDDLDVNLTEINDVNAHLYQHVTEPDSLWIEDTELIEKLQEAEINYTETKYMNVTIAIHMQEILFEHVYLQKLLFDKKYETSNITVDLTMMSPTPVSLFELEIILICILAKYYHLVPDLLTSPSKSLSVLGFNFDADLDLIKNEIKSRPDLYSQKLLDYIDNIQFNTAEDVNKMYGNVKELARLLTEVMEKTQDERVYHANKKLYMALMITDVHNEVLTLPDGSLPETYMDWLKSYDIYMYNYINELDESNCIDKINYISVKMQTLFTNTKYLKYLSPIDSSLINGITRILRWFKSYTIELKEMEVIYMFDSKYNQLMKMLNRLWFHEKMHLREIKMTFYEWVHKMIAEMMKKENQHVLIDFLSSSTAHEKYKEKDGILYELIRMSVNITLREFIVEKYIDSLFYVEGACLMSFTEKDGIFYESLNVFAQALIREGLDEERLGLLRKDLITKMKSNAFISDIMDTVYSDNQHFGTKYLKFIESDSKFKEHITSISETIRLVENSIMKDDLIMSVVEYLRELALSVYMDTFVIGTKYERQTERVDMVEAIEQSVSSSLFESMKSDDKFTIERINMLIRNIMFTKYIDFLHIGTKEVQYCEYQKLQDYIEFMNKVVSIRDNGDNKDSIFMRNANNMIAELIKFNYMDILRFGTKVFYRKDIINLLEIIRSTKEVATIRDDSHMIDKDTFGLLGASESLIREIANKNYSDLIVYGTKSVIQDDTVKFNELIKNIISIIQLVSKSCYYDTVVLKGASESLLTDIITIIYSDSLSSFYTKQFILESGIIEELLRISDNMNIEEINQVLKDKIGFIGSSLLQIKDLLIAEYMENLSISSNGLLLENKSMKDKIILPDI